ncbi:MAG: tetratricopeptide repeat protein [Gemmatimonadetes bacterium]|nr:tetratricopeptide repeat protein [Gemmatimonadota bacterium]
MTGRVWHSRQGDNHRPDGIDEGVRLEGATAPEWGPRTGSPTPFSEVIPDPTVANDDVSSHSAGDLLSGQAHRLAVDGRRLEAIQTLRTMLELDPNRMATRHQLADLLAGGGDLAEAIEELSAGLAIDPSGASIWVARGALYARAGRSQEAEADFRRAVAQDPSHYPAYRYLGTVLLRRGLTQGAIRQLREAMGMAPQDVEVRLAYGEALAASGDEADAEVILSEVAETMPADPRPYQLLGRLFDRQGRTDEAVAMHRKAREAQSA